jgi:hypothetical protein
LSLLTLSGALVADAEDSSVCEATGIAFPISPGAVAEEIDRRGPHILWEIYHDEESWHDFIKNIASGKREWLDIALRCMNAADAHPAEELNAAFGAALKLNPESCLKLAQFEERTSRRDLFATFPAYDYPTLDEPQTELKARINAVKTVSGDDLASIKEECLADLKAELKAVRKLFGALDEELQEDSPHYELCEIEVSPSMRTPEDPLCKELSSGPKHIRESNGEGQGGEILEFYRLMLFEPDDDIYTIDEDLLVFEHVSGAYRHAM